MNQSARPDTQPVIEGMPVDSADAQLGQSGVDVQPARGAWTGAVAQLTMLRQNVDLIRPQMAPLVAPGILCAVATLLVEHRSVNWFIAICTLLACLFAQAGVGALNSSERLNFAPPDASYPALQRRFGAVFGSDQGQAGDALHTFAFRLGCVLIGVAVVCSAPIIFAGPVPAMLVMGLGILAIALLGVDFVRHWMAPFDEFVGPICLGPGLVLLTVGAQGYRMSMLEWGVAVALGCMALAFTEGRRLRVDLPDPADKAQSVDSEYTPGASRSLAMLFGRRVATMVAATALVVAYGFSIVLSLPRVGAPGALLAITSLPVAVIALSGLATSDFEPTRRAASNRLAAVYSWYGLALAVGMAFTVLGEYITSIIMRAIGA
ncbi:MAG TPA: prenyltransferase [Ktedonobacterales bacterium]